VGPFTATGAAITLTVDPAIQLTLVVSGSNLVLTCHPYPNNTAATGIVASAPAGSPASPVIATASAGAAAPAATATTAAPAATPTTAAPATAPAAASSLASTGPGPHLWVVAVIGFVVLYLGSVVLALVERPRSLLRRMLRMAPQVVPAPVGPVDAVAASPVFDRPVVHRPVLDRKIRPEPPSAKPAYPRAGGSPGLWFDGWEPTDRNPG
jgi:hypothetical protein